MAAQKEADLRQRVKELSAEGMEWLDYSYIATPEPRSARCTLGNLGGCTNAHNGRKTKSIITHKDFISPI